jgi:hypothetical protein
MLEGARARAVGALPDLRCKFRELIYVIFENVDIF